MNQPPPGPGGMPQGPPQQSVHPGYPQGAPPPGYPVHGQPVQPAQKKSSSCLIAAIIGGGVLLVFGGIVAALGIYGMRRYLASAKSSEAKNTVGAISRGAMAAYEREQFDPATGTTKHILCSSARPVPLNVPSGMKYQSSPSDWAAGGPNVGWQCLRFEMSMPQYYQYNYRAGSGYVATGNPDLPTGPGFEASAKGDLDGDGTHSIFARTGTISGGMLKATTQLYIENEFE